MKRFIQELEFVAQVLNYSSFRAKETQLQVNSLKEQDLIEVLRANKVVVKFEKNLERLSVSNDLLFSKFPLVRRFYEETNSRNGKDIADFSRIAGIFEENGIRFILIKSDGTFPYESDNLDVLVRNDDLNDAVLLLMRAGYKENSVVREPHKFLFRNPGTSLALHIHTRVEWEGTRFVNTEELWDNSRTACDHDTFLVPSPEDCILITAAHFFFENHAMTLYDLDKVRTNIQGRSLNWVRMLDHARKQCWEDALVVALHLVDSAYRLFYGHPMLKGRILPRTEDSDVAVRILTKTVKPFNSAGAHAQIPIEIPYVVSAFFFVRRILRAPNQSPIGKAKHLNSIASSILRRGLRPY